jgi:hypothetical protein
MAKGSKTVALSPSERRRQRVAAELRANLLKRKAQARARAQRQRGAVKREGPEG